MDERTLLPEKSCSRGSGLDAPFSVLLWQRLSVLVCLLLLQSMSQFVLEAYEGLVATNLVIPLFLTMLVGAGGNAGNQSAVRSITGLVTGALKPAHVVEVVRREFFVGISCGCLLSLIAFLRVYYFYANDEVQPTGVFVTVFSITLSLFLIVVSSVIIGGSLPFFLRWTGYSVEHAAPMIQVIMDILGVWITCSVCSLFLPSTPTATKGPTPVAAQ